MKKVKWQMSLLLVCMVCLLLFSMAAHVMMPSGSVSAAVEEEIDNRIALAEELGLEAWIDNEGYLIEDFYEGKTDKELSELGIDALVRTMTAEEVDEYVAQLSMGISPLTVTKYQKVGQVNPDTGRTLYTGIFEVDGVLAYCIERSVETPAKGSSTGTPKLITNSKLRKVLYYGYNGPKDRGYTYVETALAAGEANGDGDNSLGRKILAEIVEYAAPPSSFKVWKVETNEGKTQDLAYYTIEKGSIKVKKGSANPEVTEGNSCYSLKGAKYGLYSNVSCTSASLVGTFTIKEDGSSNTLYVETGTYYLKEMTAPKSYALDTTVKNVTVKADKTTTVAVTDIPQMNPVSILLAKEDAETNQNTPQGSATLQGAQFTVKYYDGFWNEGVDPEMEGEVPVRTWIFQTDEAGFCNYSKEYFVSGDDIYLDSSDVPALPLGTVTIQETKAPEGYLLNSDVYVRQITNEGSEKYVDTYQEPTIPDYVQKLNLVKYQSDTSIPISQTTFKHLKPDGSIEALQTDKDGQFTIVGLEYGTHKIWEVSAMDGYIVNENVIVFEIAANNVVTLVSTCDESKGEITFGVTQEGNIALEVYDSLAPYELCVNKKNNMGRRLEGAEFALYSDKDCRYQVASGVTDKNGILKIKNLKVGTKYYLKETKAPAGYQMPTDENGNEIVHEIYTQSVPAYDEFTFYVNGKAYDDNSNGAHTLAGTKANREVNVTIINEIGYQLPNTGSTMMPIMMFAGTVLCGVGIDLKNLKGGKINDEK